MMSVMHFMIGCKTDECVILASDKFAYSNGFLLSKDDCKNIKLGEKLYMCCIGEAVDKFSEQTQNHFRLHKIRYEYEMGPLAAHHWIRKFIADSQRSGNQWKLDVFLGGYDDKEGKTWLSSIDSNARDNENNKNYIVRASGGCRGFSEEVAMSHLYQPKMNREKALEAVKQCIQESQKNLQTYLGTFNFVVIDKNGFYQENINI
uniref:Proteasome subunit beta n=1 Tax=Panagrolaimus sp. ES5 TaxID=591445 RepID=A0AC34FE04_9BILA